MINYTKELILYVDDEHENLDGFKFAFMKDYDISVAQSAEGGLKILEQRDIKVIISDQKMPEVSGIEFLKTVKEKYPDTIRIVLTAYADVANAVEAINKGEIYRYLSKPWEKTDLKSTIDNALESYNLKLENKNLIKNLKKVNQELSQVNDNLNKKIIELEETQEELLQQNEEYISLNEEYKTQNEELLKTIVRAEESESQLLNLNNNLTLITEIEKIGTFNWDLKSNLTTWNDEMFIIHGIPKQVPMPYENWVNTIYIDDVEKATSELGKAITNKSVEYAEFRIVRPNGEIRFVHASATVLINVTGEVTNAIGVTVDITARKKVEIALKKKNKDFASLNEEYKIQNDELIIAKEKAEENERKFRDMADLLPLIVYEVDLNGNFIFVNRFAFDSFGYSDEIFENKFNVLQMIIPEDRNRAKEIMQNILLGKIYNNTEYTALRKDGSTFPIVVYSSVILNENKPIGIRGAIADITEIKSAEKELISAKQKAEESDKLKTEFINNMSHEIRTPMNGIMGFSNFLTNPDLSDAKRKNYINIIKNSGNQLMRIIDDILEISKLGTKQVYAVNDEVCLNDLLLELFSICDIKAKENKIPLYLKKGLSDKESTIFTDKSKLNKILSNLIENALKFTKKGFIEFGYQLKTDSDSLVTELVEAAEAAELEIYVKDSGIGIVPDKQKIIFDRFSQEEKGLSQKVGGLGLGLSIAKENAELLGGKITLKSEKGKGATFFVTIPYKPVISKAKKINSDNIKEKNIKNQDKYSILIVEDEEVNSLYIDTLLENTKQNLKTIYAKDGQEAVEICKENSEINLVLMDLKMPIMNGYEATKLIKEFRPDLLIIAQTAYSTEEEKKEAFLSGCSDFISKPISEETLNKIINKYLIMK